MAAKEQDETVGAISPLANRIAHDFLATDGISAIWKLHLVAGVVYEAGYRSAAQLLLEAADVTEELLQFTNSKRASSYQSSSW